LVIGSLLRDGIHGERCDLRHFLLRVQLPSSRLAFQNIGDVVQGIGGYFNLCRPHVRQLSSLVPC
jgi:hypothetical protein